MGFGSIAPQRLVRCEEAASNMAAAAVKNDLSALELATKRAEALGMKAVKERCPGSR